MRSSWCGDGGPEVWIEYDSTDSTATLDGSYRTARVRERAERAGAVHETFALRGARFANRQNGGADFRLVVRGGVAGIRSVAVR